MRGDPRDPYAPDCWAPAGSSYAALANTSSSEQHRRADPAHAAGGGRAGLPNSHPHRGAGSFVKQATWSLGSGGSTAKVPTSEARAQFMQAPAGTQRTRPAAAAESQFPRPNEPRDGRTNSQVDFGAEKLAGAERRQPFKPVDGSGSLLPKDCAPQYTTGYASTFDCKTADAGSRAGNPAAKNPGYNIITGGSSLGNGVFERFDGRDYRRHR
ncbi:hypothetical protein FOA52_015353 [Chlamydomonas sp. UWO 241]|nr:hypothetical protein FOA52_015353 [Chlamydomonas sp. UWO 241]